LIIIKCPQPLDGFRLLDSGEIFPQQILDDGDFYRIAVGEDGRNGRKSRQSGGLVAPFTGNNDIDSPAPLAYEDRLQYAMPDNGGLQFSQGLLVEVLARLFRVGPQGCNAQVVQLPLEDGSPCGRRRGLRINRCSE